MESFGGVAAYAIFGSLAVAAVVGILWIGGQLAWTAFDDFFLSPARQLVESLRAKRSDR